MMNQGGNNQSARARLRLVAGLSVMATLVLVSSFGCTGGGRAGSADLISEDEVVADVDGGGLDIPGDADLVPEELVGELPAPEAVSGEFTLLTYNVAGLPEGISSSHPEEYIPLISPMLNAFELVLVQEDFVYHEQLAAEVDHPHHTPSLYDSLDDFPLGDGLNRFSLFPMGRVHRLQWPGCSGELDCSSDCLASKGFSLARTELAGGLSVDVYNLHGEAGGCPADVELRALGYHRLVEFIGTWSQGRPVIVAGDFNLRWNDPEDVAPLQLLLDAGLTEACLALDCGDERIDKVFFRSAELLELEPLQWSVPPQFVRPDGAALSDHEPVAVRFAWTGIPAADGDSGIGHEIYPEEISVVTLNMLHGLSDEDPAAQPFDLLGSRVELIRAELSARGDALVALQEVALMPMEGYPDLMEPLLSVLGRGSCPACHALFGAVGGAPPTFDAGDAVGQLTMARLPQSGPVHNRQISPFRTVTHLRVDSALGKVDFYNLHLEGGGAGDDGLAEAEAVLAFVEETSRPDHLVILAGDLNSTPDSAALACFSAAGFIDLAATSGMGCSPYDDGSGCTASTLPLTEEGNRTSQRIDYLLLRAEVAPTMDCAPRFAAPVPVDGGVLWPSDHIGLGCVLR